MRTASTLGRVAALLAVVAAVVVVAVIFFRGDDYTVKAEFVNAGQLVEGNLVQVGGTGAGSVKKIEISDDGQAILTLSIDERYKPLRRGTKAVIRQASLSGIANRYVDLQLPEGRVQEEMEEGETIQVDDTTTAVDLDEIFNTLDPIARTAVQDFLQGSADQFAGKGDEANAGLLYLNPALSSGSRLFNELGRDEVVLERFLVDSAKFVTALADRKEDLAALVTNLNRTTGAIGNQREALAQVLQRLPTFLRTANTTFANLRTTLDDVDPLLAATRPVAPKLRRLFAELRPFARDAAPTLRDLNQIVSDRGPDNDLIDLSRTFPDLAEAALDTKTRNGERRRGSFPETAEALRSGAPLASFGRAYTPDLFGWFDDFSTTGVYDALGGISRTQGNFNVFTVTGGTPTPIPLSNRGENFKSFAKIKQFRRCPGAGEIRAADGSNVYTEAQQRELDCDESHRGPGPEQP